MFSCCFFFCGATFRPPTAFVSFYRGRLHVFVAKEIFSWSKGRDPRGCQVPEQPRSVGRLSPVVWNGWIGHHFQGPKFPTTVEHHFKLIFWENLKKQNNLKKKTHGKKDGVFFFCWYLTFEKVPVQTFYINLGLFFLRFGPKLRWRRKKLQFFIFRNGKNHHISAWCVRKAQPSTRNYQIIK